jgi:hypothetical protein
MNVGYITLKARTVADACAKWLKWRDEQVEAEREKMIAELVAHRWYGKMSREEAIKYLKETQTVFGSKWDDPTITGHTQHMNIVTAHTLTKTAIKNNVEHITINAQVNSWLAIYL